jgi:hypothetical protein
MSHSRTLKRFDAALGRVIHPLKYAQLESNLEELNLVLHDHSLAVIFSAFSFQRLQKIALIVTTSSSHSSLDVEFEPLEWPNEINLPSLKYLGFTNQTSSRSPFLSRCKQNISRSASIQPTSQIQSGTWRLRKRASISGYLM